MLKNELLAKWSELQKVGTDGFVRLVDCMGGDDAIVQAARTSYGAGTKAVSEDQNLIRYLMRHWHTTPFEMCEIKFHVRVPMDIWRQWIRHRTASVNEYSTRYSEAIDSQNFTSINEWRLQSTNNKQGSFGLLIEDTDNGASKAAQLTVIEGCAINQCIDAYNDMLAANIAREQARKILPLSTYTEAYWKIDLHNLFHFLRLRLDPHAQQEIREFAQAIANVVKDWVPCAWQAFEDYRLNAVQFSAAEMKAIRAIVSGGLGIDYEDFDDTKPDETQGWEQVAVDVGGMYGTHTWARPCTIFDMSPSDRESFLNGKGLTTKRERIEFWNKIKG